MLLKCGECGGDVDLLKDDSYLLADANGSYVFTGRTLQCEGCEASLTVLCPPVGWQGVPMLPLAFRQRALVTEDS